MYCEAIAQQRCWLARLHDRRHRILLPRGLVADHRIQNGEQLVHGCHEHHLLGFVPQAQTCVEGVDGVIVAATDALKFVPDAGAESGMNYSFGISCFESR